MRVVIIGAGKIGAGYLAPLFRGAGWQVTLATRTPASAARAARSRSYTVTVVPAPAQPGGPSGEPVHHQVSGHVVVPIGSDAFRSAVAEADLVCTAVGVGNVHALADPLADALAARPADRPLDVWVVENGDCAPALGRQVHWRNAELGAPVAPVGFAGAVAKVAVGRGSWDEPAPDFVGDDARCLLVDGTALAGPMPELAGVSATSHYRACLLAKLHVFNAGHAICAYLGWLRGHATVDAAAADPLLRPMLAGSMLESQRALLVEHPMLGTDACTPVADALRRFANTALGDPVARVGRDPVRKLGGDDRLVGPMRAIWRVNERVPAYFALGVAGALLYRNPGDPQAVELQRSLVDHGVLAVLSDTCGLPPEHPLALAVARRYRGFIFADDEVLFPPAYADPCSPADALEVVP